MSPPFVLAADPDSHGVAIVTLRLARQASRAPPGGPRQARSALTPDTPALDL